MNLCRIIAMCLMMVWAIGSPAATMAAADQPAVQPTELIVGQPAPGFDLTLMNGKKATLRQFRGKSVVVVFWRSG
jgi:cytochrome oxidase Cu insertion factor (SCO1/SenC/PrrC family)